MKSTATFLTLAAVLAAPLVHAQTAPAAPDVARGQTIATQVCAACHTVDATRGSPANPILAGQHADYLAKQLADFKTDKRPSAIMKGFASTLSDDDMRHVAAFYAAQPVKPGFAKNKDFVALGEKIFRGGIGSKQVPACAGCHSPTGAGMPSQFPRVGGQHAEYTEAQMVAFRDGVRSHPMMTPIAGKMSDREVKAVADYMAGLR